MPVIKRKTEPTQEELKAMFNYCPNSGRLIRKVQAGRYPPGSISGHESTATGHRAIRIGKHNYSERRCVWIYHHGGENMPNQIGARNRLVDDNRIENLYAKGRTTQEAKEC